MVISRWWKCDLQVATPGGGFKPPAGTNTNWSDPKVRAGFADAYMEQLASKGIEVIALADHNSADWISDMREAGERAGIHVFPGVEITTGSGADGVHLQIIGSPSRTKNDFDTLLAGTCGFGEDNPKFDADDKPAPAPKSITQILDGLPDRYLVLAPHALGDNGIASGRKISGSLRWRAIHSDRLNAIDVGDPRESTGDPENWNARFRRRALDDYPRLKTLAFVSTSDAYSMSRLGSRFTWIRMAEPTLEALRQAFLDFEARIVCDWDERCLTRPDPNVVLHGWIRHLHLAGPLGNSASDITIDFDPHLNVIIGGRGAGKSTIVAGLRQIYGTLGTLPAKMQEEARDFATKVFGSATITAAHRLPNSQEEQPARWTAGEASTTFRPEGGTPTTFPVRVVSQKELFERAAYDREDGLAASRNLLSLVDEQLGTRRSDRPLAGSFGARLIEMQNRWTAATQKRLALEREVGQRADVLVRHAELGRQLEALDAPQAKARRLRNDRFIAQRRAVTESSEEFAASLGMIERTVIDVLPLENDMNPDEAAESGTYLDHIRSLGDLRLQTRTSLLAVLEAGRAGLASVVEEQTNGSWAEEVAAAAADAQAYERELAGLGVDPSSYQQLRRRLAETEALMAELDRKSADLSRVVTEQEQAWQALLDVLEDRRRRRRILTDEVAQRSGVLRFDYLSRYDAVAWTRTVRSLLNLRADGFLTDVPATAKWLWSESDPETRMVRQELWRRALVNNDYSTVAPQLSVRQSWIEKLRGLDETVRVRLATEIADDAVVMRFLKSGGNPSDDVNWQPITEGSPGQRSAAMLSFVLHHGDEPLILDQPEDDLDTDWISTLIVGELRTSRARRQVVVVTHNANIPVNADAEQIIAMENVDGSIRIRSTSASTSDGSEVRIIHAGPIELDVVRTDVQELMEGGVTAFIRRERKYNNELNVYRASLRRAPPNPAR